MNLNVKTFHALSSNYFANSTFERDDIQHSTQSHTKGIGQVFSNTAGLWLTGTAQLKSDGGKRFITMHNENVDQNIAGLYYQIIVTPEHKGLLKDTVDDWMMLPRKKKIRTTKINRF